MRTTLTLDDDVYELIKGYAAGRSLTLGMAASELVRKGLEPPVRMRKVNGFFSVVLPSDSPKVSAKQVRRLIP
jgi:hypothetical protein